MTEHSTDFLIVVLGPTAVGKTSLAVDLAKQIGGEIISADSRQVYRNMHIGTGKDIQDYLDADIPYHLIDIRDAGEAYDVFQFQRDFYKAYHEISEKKKLAILCGGSGMYIEAALRKNQLIEVPENLDLRRELVDSTMPNLISRLNFLKPNQHNTTDLIDRERLLRAIEIAEFENEHTAKPSPIKGSLLFGLKMEREKLRERIKDRLEKRFQEGMLEEVEGLLSKGVTLEQLYYYGLEYRYISSHLKGDLSFDEMFKDLLQSIRRFAKKQMTWFRRMEKQGHLIHWIDAEKANEDKLKEILKVYRNV